MDIKIPEAQMQDIVASAIFQTIDENARATLIQDAIRYLISKPEKKSYYDADPKSPLQFAFENAIGVAANKLIREQIEANPEIQQKILDLLKEALTKVFETNRTATVERIATALGSALAKMD